MAQKPPLILIPGLVCDEALWAAQVKALTDLADITIPDHKRHDSMAEIAASILAYAPEAFSLAGLSMGGYISMEIMRQAPERVNRLALLDTAPYADTPEQTAMREERIASVRENGLRPNSQDMLPLLVHPSRLSDSILIDAIVGMDESYTVDSYTYQQKAIMGRADSLTLLPTITCPTLVLCGRQDLLTPLAAHEEMADKIPDAKMLVIEDCGHMSTMERPEAVNIALREWLLS